MTSLIANLSPIAAKLYLALHLYPDPVASPPVAQVSLEDLARDTNLSQRSCTSALAELVQCQLISRLPRHPHAPSRYQIHPLAAAHPDAPLLPDSHPHATNSPADAHPRATLPKPDSHPAATLPGKTAIPASKTPHSHPGATNSIFSISPQEEALLTNPTFLKLLIPTLNDPSILAAAQSLLAQTREPHP